MNKTLLTLSIFGIFGISACTTTQTAQNGEVSVVTPPEPAQQTEVIAEEPVINGESQFLAYNEADFEAALAEGKDVFLDFHADWCPLCQANKPEIEAAFDEFGDENVIGFQVNFDKETQLRKDFKIFSQSQLVWIPAGNTENADIYPPGIYTTEKILNILNS